MSGLQATGLVEIRHDLDALAEPGFWAIVGTFEGEWTFARFSQVTKSEFNLSTDSQLEVGPWSSSLNHSEYIAYVAEIKERIARGDVYQVNACRVLNAFAKGDLIALMNRILQFNPAPFASYLSLPEIEIASASPERFVSISDGVITTSPIKGTSVNSTFLEKDHAENLMIVDLMRNDIGKVAKPGSISTPRLLATEEHPGLFHLVSDIRGEIRAGIGLAEILKELMPPGSVSGAPKSSALKIIKEREVERGPYCGAIGWWDGSRAEIAVGIRTFWKVDETIRFGTGAGITWGSNPEQEWEETELKARRLIALVSQ